jgi:hypothetical protein
LIPNTETAVKIAFIYLSQIYGEKTIIEEFPLNVDSIGGNWIITGTLHTELGGTASLGWLANALAPCFLLVISTVS